MCSVHTYMHFLPTFLKLLKIAKGTEISADEYFLCIVYAALSDHLLRISMLSVVRRRKRERKLRSYQKMSYGSREKPDYKHKLLILIISSLEPRHRQPLLRCVHILIRCSAGVIGHSPKTHRERGCPRLVLGPAITRRVVRTSDDSDWIRGLP